MNDLKVNKILIYVYFMINLFFVSMLVYMGVHEDVRIYNPRNVTGITEITDYNISYIYDSTAPAQVRKVYSWFIDTEPVAEKCLRFYTSHQYVDVFIDGEMVYSINTNAENTLGKSISSVWTNVHIYPKDEGKEIRVILTPVYDSVINNSITFTYGSLSDLLLNELKAELPDMLLASLAVIIGIFILSYQVYSYISKSIKNTNVIFMAMVSIILGVWRIMDLRFTVMLFDNYLAMGYVANGLLFLICPPIIFHFKNDLKDKDTKILDFVLIVSCVIAIAVFGMQIFNIRDFRENIYLSHVEMILTMIAVAVTIIRHKEVFIKKNYIHPTFVFVISLALGALLDLFTFYTTKDTVGLVFTLTAFIMHTIYRFYIEVKEMDYNAYMDALTGLLNKRGWKSLLKTVSTDKNVGIVVFDINNLKQINDKYGHEAGDVVIYRFAHIARSIVPIHYHMCRWGGDEFVILIEDCSQQIIDKYVNNVRAGVETYNQLKTSQQITFASGAAMTCEFEQISLEELFKVADERMYENKKNMMQKKEE